MLAAIWPYIGTAKAILQKAEKYTEQARQLDPSDSLILSSRQFSWPGHGHIEEALKIARENESLMPASYNLAAIYAQAGDKKKALDLLRRHFFTYERNISVRSKEMMEARVDRMFANLRSDPDFIALTDGADNRLPLPTETAPAQMIEPGK